MRIVEPVELLAVEEEDATPADQLTSLMDEWHKNDLENRGRPVSFTELLMEDDWDLSADAWREDFTADLTSSAPISTMGSAGQSTTDAATLVQSFMASNQS